MNKETGILLKTWGNHTSIENPSGSNTKPKEIKTGEYYLHYNKAWMRYITNVTETDVWYVETGGGGDWCPYPSTCSRAHFSRPCPTKATIEEIEFLLNK